MDEALVENAENDEGREDRRQNQDALSALGVLEDLRSARETGEDRRRQIGRTLELADAVGGGAERVARRQIEGNRHRRLLTLMVDLQRADRRHQSGYRGKRHGYVVLGLLVEF